MKLSLRAGIAGLCLMIPGVSLASTISFEVTGSQYTLLFDPQGSGPSTLPPSCYYRSYDCRIGQKPVVFTLPPVIYTNPIDVKPPADPKDPNPPVNQPVDPDPVRPTNPASVPLPASSEMAGAGLAVAATFSWIRSRRLARA